MALFLALMEKENLITKYHTNLCPTDQANQEAVHCREKCPDSGLQLSGDASLVAYRWSVRADKHLLIPAVTPLLPLSHRRKAAWRV